MINAHNTRIVEKNKKSRIGMKIEQKNGKIVKCIKYKNNKDGDFKLENGKVIQHKRWSDFVAGKFNENTKNGKPSKEYTDYNWSSPAKNERIGTVLKQKCGMNAECIAYRSNKDCDLRLENGVEMYHRRWQDFIRGRFAGTNLHYERRDDNARYISEQRIGLKIQQNCGLDFEITRYINSNDVEGIFPDGTVREHLRFDKIKEGKVTPWGKGRKIFLGYNLISNFYSPVLGIPVYQVQDKNGNIMLKTLMQIIEENKNE